MDVKAICKALYEHGNVHLENDGEEFFDIMAQDDDVKDAAVLAHILSSSEEDIDDACLNADFSYKQILAQALLAPKEVGHGVAVKAYSVFETSLREALWFAVPKYFGDQWMADYVDRQIDEQKERAA